VETDEATAVEVDGKRLGRILVTHLHSYASPIIRYDNGDLGILLESCPCGHRGPTLTEVHGRRKTFLRHPDGRLTKFYFVAKVFSDVLDFSEISFRQTDQKTVLLQLKRPQALTKDEETRVRQLLAHWIDHVFDVDIRVVDAIDWSRNPKHLLFINDLT
jgi:phenylacetate-coenzyme A ligase PaaK-like adenylate-forming protein